MYISTFGADPSLVFDIASSEPMNVTIRNTGDDKLVIGANLTTSYNNLKFLDDTGIIFTDDTSLTTSADLLKSTKIDPYTLEIDVDGNLNVREQALIWKKNSQNSIYYYSNSVGINIQDFNNIYKLYVNGNTFFKNITINPDFLIDRYTWNYFNISDTRTIFNQYYQTYLGNNAYKKPENIIHHRVTETNTGFWFGSGIGNSWQQWLHINDYELSTDRNFAFTKRSTDPADDVGILFSDNTTLKTSVDIIRYGNLDTTSYSPTTTQTHCDVILF